jgi:hypothetical protein
MWREKVVREGLGKNERGETSRARPKGFIHRLNQETISYFFTNFPGETKVMELWQKFGRFGRVGEVYIPNKVDKQGQRFGFVKFGEVEDAVEMLRRISNIWVGSFKLRVNLPKFDRNMKPTTEKERNKDFVTEEPRPKTLKNHQGQVEKSFKNAVAGQGSGGDGGKGVQVGVTAAKAEVIWEVEEEEEMLTKLAGAYVGILIEEKDSIGLQNNFRLNGLAMVLLWSDTEGGS